jgi:hypothetical protein
MLTHRLWSARPGERQRDEPDRRALDAIGRAVHRVVHPQHVEERETLEKDFARAVAAGASSEREQLERLRKHVDGLSEKLSAFALDRDVRGLHHHVIELKDASARQHKMLAHGLRFAEWQGGTPRRRAAHRPSHY